MFNVFGYVYIMMIMRWCSMQTNENDHRAIMYSIICAHHKTVVGQKHSLPRNPHYCDVIMGVMTSHITGVAIVYSTVYSPADQRKHQSSASLAFAQGIHRWLVNFLHKWPVTRKMFPFDDVIMWKNALGLVLVILEYNPVIEWRADLAVNPLRLWQM